MISLYRLFKGYYKYCECGYCKTLIPCVNKSRKFLKYVQGHQAKGKNNYHWNNGITTPKNGYNYIRINGKKKYIHRLVYEEYYNCCLLSYVVIHHKNKNIKDNNIENLQPFITNGKHLRYELTGTRFELVDMSGRRCSNSTCPNPNDPYKRKGNDRPLWKSDSEGNRLCSVCYNRWYRRKNKVI